MELAGAIPHWDYHVIILSTGSPRNKFTVRLSVKIGNPTLEEYRLIRQASAGTASKSLLSSGLRIFMIEIYAFIQDTQRLAPRMTHSTLCLRGISNLAKNYTEENAIEHLRRSSLSSLNPKLYFESCGQIEQICLQ
jgi:hypothetical protein